MGRSPCCSKVGMNKGAWTAAEDKILTDHIKLHGEGKWRNLPKKAGLKRCGKSCRLRWLNYLRPDIKRGNISHDEEELIIRLHKLLGNRWSLIAGRLPGRTDNEIKNYWNTTLGKKVQDNSVSNRKHSIDGPSNEMTKKKVGEIESTHKHNSNVVRTKAVRCSKTIFTPQPRKFDPVDPNKMPRRVDTVEENKSATRPIESGFQNGVPSFFREEENPSNFMLDVDMGEIASLSDLFNSDVNGEFDFNSPIMEGDDLSPASSDGPQLLTKELLDYFSSIPEFGGDWLHEN